jgi:hypothetical protein
MGRAGLGSLISVIADSTGRGQRRDPSPWLRATQARHRRRAGPGGLAAVATRTPAAARMHSKSGGLGGPPGPGVAAVTSPEARLVTHLEDSNGLGWTRMDSDGLGWTRMTRMALTGAHPAGVHDDLLPRDRDT